MSRQLIDPRYMTYGSFRKRQTVVTGVVDANGLANFLSQATNAVSLNASSTDPVVVTFANGFNPFPVDYAYSWTGTVNPSNWGTLSSNTHYLYIDYDPATETVTYDKTLVMPSYGTVAPSHGSGVCWFNLTKYKMYESVASAWVEKTRVFVGEVVSNGTNITSLSIYALNGTYDSGWFAVAPGNNYTKNHNIGIRLQDGVASTLYYSLDSAGADSAIAHDTFADPNVAVGAWVGPYNREDVANSTTHLQYKFGLNTVMSIQLYRNAYRTTGYLRILLSRSW